LNYYIVWILSLYTQNFMFSTLSNRSANQSQVNVTFKQYAIFESNNAYHITYALLEMPGYFTSKVSLWWMHCKHSRLSKSHNDSALITVYSALSCLIAYTHPIAWLGNKIAPRGAVRKCSRAASLVRILSRTILSQFTTHTYTCS